MLPRTSASGDRNRSGDDTTSLISLRSITPSAAAGILAARSLASTKLRILATLSSASPSASARPPDQPTN